MPSLTRPGPMIVPADFEARLAPLIGTPFRAKGEDRAGWDCRGCAHWIYRHELDVEVEGYAEAYEATDVLTIASGARRARLIAERLARWRPVEAQAGAVVQLLWLGRAGHVGVMTGRDRYIHADLSCGTVVGRLGRGPYRALGFFVPSFVTEVRHERP